MAGGQGGGMAEAGGPGVRLRQHQHGKARVRLARVWRLPDGRQEFVEWE